MWVRSMHCNVDLLGIQISDYIMHCNVDLRLQIYKISDYIMYHCAFNVAGDVM